MHVHGNDAYTRNSLSRYRVENTCNLVRKKMLPLCTGSHLVKSSYGSKLPNKSMCHSMLKLNSTDSYMLCI